MQGIKIVKQFHNQISKFKDTHLGETCYIFGSGPSVSRFKEIDPLKPCVYIGGNHIIKNPEIRNKLQYYFFGHGYQEYRSEDSSQVYHNHYKEVNSLPLNIQKFCMVSKDNTFIMGYHKDDLPKLRKINAIPCDMTGLNIFKDIDVKPFLNHSIIFPQLQFALYAGFTKIYLVGCDCTCYNNRITTISRQPYFFHEEFKDGNTQSKIVPNKQPVLIRFWKLMREFVGKNYSNTTLISLNPVNLKGIFKDVYT
jgi:hypothetical protein